jgi:two-component system, NarL family, sensor kinase
MRRRILDFLILLMIGVISPTEGVYAQVEAIFNEQRDTVSIEQGDTISIEHALANVERLRVEKPGDDLAGALKILATRFLIDKGLTHMAVEAYQEAIEVQKIYQDSTSMYLLYLDLAMLQITLENYHAALNLLEEASDYFKEKNDATTDGISLNFLADAYIAASDPDRAIIYANESRALAGPSGLLNRLNSNTITALIRNGESVEGLEELDTTAIERSPTRTRLDQDYTGLPELNSGYYQMSLGNFALADYYLRQAMSATLDGVILRDALSYLAEIHRTTGDYEKAYKYLYLYSTVNDSLLNVKRQQIINRLRIQLQSFEQQAKIKVLEKEKNVADIVNRMQKIVSVALLIASFIILIGTYFTIRNYQKRMNANQIIHVQNEEINKRKITDLENNLKIETMHSMITGQEAERERIAKDLHDSLGGLLSTVKLHFDAIQTQDEHVSDLKEYRKAYSLLDDACNEVRDISNNMQPGALLSMGVVPAISDLVNRFHSDETPQIDFQHFDVSNNIEQTTALNIYRIVQELLTNSLKHANATHILIQLDQKEDELMITVEDDGAGYNPDAVDKGMGTGNIASRVNFLKGDLNIHSVRTEGTSTLITIPLSS